LGRITDEQLRDGLAASGAGPDEAERFTRAIRDRINQLKRAVEEGNHAGQANGGTKP
jgi:50S ribosomal subunit-associated GTPase HflX